MSDLVEPSLSTMAPEKSKSAGWAGSVYGLATAVCWSVSPVLIRKGLAEFPHPLMGVAVGMIASTIAVGVLLLARRRQRPYRPVAPMVMVNQIVAGVLTGVATLMRWAALAIAPVGVVVALGRLNVVVVIFVTAFMKGKYAENIGPRVWLGGALIVVGSILLI